jgi:hypothetical protein
MNHLPDLDRAFVKAKELAGEGRETNTPFFAVKYILCPICFEAGCYYCCGNEGGVWRKWFVEMK